MSNKNDHDIYIIPPNFIETGTFFGGMFRARNVIEAGILALAIGTPVFLCLPFGLTARIIALCLTALPVALVALIGISGESLSQFLITFLKYLRNRRVVGGDGEQPCEKTAPSKSAGKHLKQKPPKERKPKAPKRRRSGEADFPAEFDEVRGYEIREKLRPKKNAKKDRPAKGNKAKKNAKKRHEKERLPKRPARVKEQKPACLNPVADYLPIEKVENGIIYTKDHRFVKVVEVVPINFMLRSAREQRNIIYSFVSYLKISPIKLQIKVLTRRADINRHLDTVRQEMAHEENEQCRLMQEDYLNFVQQVGSREAVTRRFFLIFEYEPWANTRRSEQEDEAIQSLQSAVHTASNYLRQCGNEVVVHENEDEFTVDVFYNLLCRNESAVKPLSVRAQEIVAQYLDKGREGEIDRIPAAEFAAPKSIDFTHGRYLCIIIPIKEMMINLGRSPSGQEYADLMLRQNKILGNMLGADIDFVVRGIDSKTRSVVASRREAMMRKRQTFYFDLDAEGKYRIYEGRIVQARVIAVAEKVIRVEVFGVETSILARDLAWDWIGDAHERFSVGDEVLVRILNVRRNSLEDLGIRADIKSTSENTDRDNLQKCRIQGKYAGKVTDVHKGVVYVRLANGVNAVAHSCYDYRMPGKKDDVSFAVTHLDVERGIALGIITRIIRQNL